MYFSDWYRGVRQELSLRHQDYREERAADPGGHRAGEVRLNQTKPLQNKWIF